MQGEDTSRHGKEETIDVYNGREMIYLVTDLLSSPLHVSTEFWNCVVYRGNVGIFFVFSTLLRTLRDSFKTHELLNKLNPCRSIKIMNSESNPRLTPATLNPFADIP